MENKSILNDKDLRQFNGGFISKPDTAATVTEDADELNQKLVELTNEELNALKEEVEALSKKLSELNEEELAQVTGGLIPPYPPTSFFGDGGKVALHDVPQKTDDEKFVF